jgi:hypothetical protein
MLQALSPMVVVALTRAHEARERADDACSSRDRDFWLEMEQHWVKLAQSYEAHGRLGTYLRGLSLKETHQTDRAGARHAAIAANSVRR